MNAQLLPRTLYVGLIQSDSNSLCLALIVTRKQNQAIVLTKKIYQGLGKQITDIVV